MTASALTVGLAACLATTCLTLTPTAAAETRALVVAGLGGEPGYEAAFRSQANDSAEALSAVSSDVTVLTGEQVDRERLREALAGLATRSRRDDDVTVILIGHGSYDDHDYRFNVPGLDVTGAELASWLSAVTADRQLVVVATSASGALQSLLERDHRTVITATRSGGERDATVFSRYFAESLGAASADTDKDGYVSVTEAFRFADSAVRSHYRVENQMATEHPVLGGSGYGIRLARLSDAPVFDAGTATDRRRLAALESDIEVLRNDKANRPVDAYYAELQRLMTEMALLRRRIGEESAP